jgi:hypothetical protein
MKTQITTIKSLRIGQRFTFLPPCWYGPCRLTHKTKRYDNKYDLNYDARVINPPGIIYGISGETKVKTFKQTWKKLEYGFIKLNEKGQIIGGK